MDIWFKEQEPYTKEQIRNAVVIDEEDVEDFNSFFNYLLNTRILKKKGKDVEDEAEEAAEDEDENIIESESNDNGLNNQNYAFYYVGIVIWKQFSIKCFPKYITNKEDAIKKFPLIIKVIEKYKSDIRKGKKKEDPNYTFYESGKGDQINRLELALQLLINYYENGIYSNTKTIYEINGSGEIDWDRTANKSVAFIFDGTPYYIDTVTSRQVNSNSNYIFHLHEFILSQCSRDLIKADLLGVLNIDEVFLTDMERDDFGELDFILYNIQSEYQRQFVTWKQEALRLMYTYMIAYRADEMETSKCFYGTKFFHTIWEDVCKKVLSNTLDENVESILRIFGAESEIEQYKDDEIEVYIKDEYSHKMRRTKMKYLETKLINLISSPRWIRDDKEAYAATLIPDLISINKFSNKRCFSILDAKYYDICISGGSVKNNPGVGDVTKQYLYQLAYNPFIEKHHFFYVQNLFLCPGEKRDTEYGRVEMDIFGYIEGLQLECIRVVKLPADEVFEKYISGKIIDDDEFFELIPKPTEIRFNRMSSKDTRILSYIKGLGIDHSLQQMDLNRKAVFYSVVDMIDLKGISISPEERDAFFDLAKDFSAETIESNLDNLHNLLFNIENINGASNLNDIWIDMKQRIYEIYGIDT